MSLIGTGYNASISYIPEPSYGTAPTTYTMLEIGRVTSVDLSISSEHLSIYGLDTQIRVQEPQGNETYELSVEFYINDVAWAFINEIDDSQSYQFLITQIIGATTYYTVLQGCIISSISISGSSGEGWTASATIKVQKIVNDEITSTAPANIVEYTRSTDGILMCHGGKLSSGTGWTTGASEDLVETTDVEVTLDYTHTENNVLNSNYVEGFYEGNIEVSFSFTCNFINLEQFKRILGDEKGNLVIHLETTGYNITLNNCVYDEVPYSISEGELINLEISGTAASFTLADT